ncbi:MAG: ferritin family protein [bacterium]
MSLEYNLKEELEALQIALKTEQDGYQYFKESSERTNHPVAKKFFASLASDEMIHIELIKEFHRSLQSDPDSAAVSLPNIPGDLHIRLKTIFEEAQAEIDQNIPPDTGILDVYRHSMDLEVKAAEFYKQRRDATTFKRARKIYDWLFHFESYHYRMLSETLSYLENPNQWFLDLEKSIFEG